MPTVYIWSLYTTLSTCDRDLMAPRAKIFTLTPYRKSLLAPRLVVAPRVGGERAVMSVSQLSSCPQNI